MSGSVYIASSLQNRTRIQQLRDRLWQEHGIPLTYDWTAHGQITDAEQLIEISAHEAVGVVHAKCILAVLPARSGSHFELGLAFGLRIPIIMLMNEPDYVSFHRRPEIMKYTNEDAAIAAVADIVRNGYVYPSHLMDAYYNGH